MRFQHRQADDVRKMLAGGVMRVCRCFPHSPPFTPSKSPAYRAAAAALTAGIVY